MKKEIICGCLSSDHSDADVEYAYISDTLRISQYALDVRADVIDQGADGNCVSQCLFEMIRYRSDQAFEPCQIDRLWVYERRQNKGIQGMTPREGMEILHRNGIVGLYARISSTAAAKSALVACGPILIVLPAYDFTDQFWAGEGRPVGYHAVTVTEFNSERFVFKNTWGTGWGSYGYGFLSVNDFNKIMESWVILS